MVVPVQITLIPRDVMIPINTQTRALCSATGKPTPKITWSRYENKAGLVIVNCRIPLIINYAWPHGLSIIVVLVNTN